jgi:hypothetical protein
MQATKLKSLALVNGGYLARKQTVLDRSFQQSEK